MADAPQKLSLADHAVIHLTAYLAMEWPNPTTAAFQRELVDVLPLANRAIPTVAAFALVADKIVSAVPGSAEASFARDRGARAAVAFHQARAAAAIDALRGAQKPEGTHV